MNKITKIKPKILKETNRTNRPKCSKCMTYLIPSEVDGKLRYYCPRCGIEYE